MYMDMIMIGILWLAFSHVVKLVAMDIITEIFLHVALASEKPIKVYIGHIKSEIVSLAFFNVNICL